MTWIPPCCNKGTSTWASYFIQNGAKTLNCSFRKLFCATTERTNDNGIQSNQLKVELVIQTITLAQNLDSTFLKSPFQSKRILSNNDLDNDIFPKTLKRKESHQFKTLDPNVFCTFSRNDNFQCKWKSPIFWPRSFSSPNYSTQEVLSKSTKNRFLFENRWVFWRNTWFCDMFAVEYVLYDFFLQMSFVTWIEGFFRNQKQLNFGKYIEVPLS